MDSMTQVITDKINGALQFIDDNVPNGLNSLGQGIVVANFTRAELKLYDSDYLLEEQRDDNRTFSWIIMSITITFIAILVIIPNLIYWV
jgi:hypothetical protein